MTLPDSTCAKRVMFFACGLVVSLAPIAATYGAPGDTSVISGSSYSSSRRAVSADGRFILFSTPAGLRVLDRETGNQQRVDVRTDGSAATDAQQEALSADGRYVVFLSGDELTPNDRNGSYDVYLHDRQTRITELISADANGWAVSANAPSVNANGRFVAFASASSALVPGDTNGNPDIFVRDRQLGTIQRVSVDSSGAQANFGSDMNSISDDGRYVAMQSYASNLVAGDTNGQADIYVHDRVLRTTERASLNPSGEQRAAPSFGGTISGDGRYIGVFGQYRGPVLVYDRVLRRSEFVSLGPSGLGDGRSFHPSLSFDGRYITFSSESTNLVAADHNGKSDIFVRDRLTQTTSRVSVSSSGAEGNAPSEAPSISADGTVVVFTSYATNVVPSTSGNVYIHEQAVTKFNFTAKPSALAFGNQALSTSTPLSIWLHNLGPEPLAIASVSVGGPAAASFSVSNRCGSSVAVSVSCALRVNFAPTVAGASAANLRIVAGGDNELRSHALTGTGVLSSFVLSPTALSFGSVPINTATVARIVTLTNTGGSGLPLGAISLGGANPGQFVLNHNCPQNLLPAGGCTISVAFTPARKGSLSGLVNIAPGDGTATRSIALAGAGS